jgi:hypothetical protein
VDTPLLLLLLELQTKVMAEAGGKPTQQHILMAAAVAVRGQ